MLEEILKEYALPICEHLAQNATPYTTVVINSSEIRVMEDVLGIPAKENDYP